MQAIISGAGVAGLLLALSLKKLGLDTSVYEQAPEFGEGVGGEPFAITS
jgi:2-polyprenyl-6-methoxyphenol hydroxylase-like FAD-dependent oxidoreductase